MQKLYPVRRKATIFQPANCFYSQDEDVQNQRACINEMTPEAIQKQSVVLKDLTKVRTKHWSLDRSFQKYLIISKIQLVVYHQCCILIG